MKRDRVLQHLSTYEPLVEAEGKFRRAAVLVPLREMAGDKEQLEVIFTRRTSDLPTHAGQVSFPGGSFEAGDDGPEQAALREANEELAIPTDRVEVVGRLDDMITVTSFHVTPVVGVVSPEVELVPDPSEVARAFAVPMAALLDESQWEYRPHEFRGHNVRIWHFLYDGEDIWGATARMTRDMVELLWRLG